MNVIFLDLDGVLNRGTGFFIPELIAELNRIIRATGAKIVIHSSRRYNNTLGELRLDLMRSGVAGDVIDITPLPKFSSKGGVIFVENEDFDAFIRGFPRIYESERPASIWAWLDQHPEVERFVILDDTATMARLDPHFVRTEMTRGLTPADADKAIALLLSSSPDGVAKT